MASVEQQIVLALNRRDGRKVMRLLQEPVDINYDGGELLARALSMRMWTIAVEMIDKGAVFLLRKCVDALRIAVRSSSSIDVFERLATHPKTAEFSTVDLHHMLSYTVMKDDANTRFVKPLLQRRDIVLSTRTKTVGMNQSAIRGFLHTFQLFRALGGVVTTDTLSHAIHPNANQSEDIAMFILTNNPEINPGVDTNVIFTNSVSGAMPRVFAKLLEDPRVDPLRLTPGRPPAPLELLAGYDARWRTGAEAVEQILQIMVDSKKFDSIMSTHAFTSKLLDFGTDKMKEICAAFLPSS